MTLMQMMLASKGIGSSAPTDPYFSSVQLLLHGDGSFTDSAKGTTLTTYNGATTSASTYKFGTGSLDYTASTAYVSFPNSNLTFGTGDWTIEMWWKQPASIPAYGVIFDVDDQSHFFIGFKSDTTGLRIYHSPGGIDYNPTHSMVAGNWYHLAWVRYGNTITIYQNGTSIGSVSCTGINFSPTGGSTTAYLNTYGQSGRPWYQAGSYIDDFRITVGVARYTSNFTPPTEAFPNTAGSLTSVEYLVVAGGGGGGSVCGGGGGAGGYQTGTLNISTGVSYTVTVGAGGSAGLSRASGGPGGNSVFSSITSIGGGGGAGYSTTTTANNSGGSGGGGNYVNPTTSKGTGTAGQGYDGGSASSYDGGSGGGGGASQAGFNTVAGTRSGNGGDGTASSITGSSVTYAGGGGGGVQIGYLGNVAGQPGAGGGGYGASSNGTNGTTNLGGGGGGGGYNSGDYNGGAGGSGVVIIRYASGYANVTSTTGTPTYSETGGYRIFKFTGSGSITF